MNIKGPAVKSMVTYMEKEFPHLKKRWLDGLSAETKKYFTQPILATNWYPIDRVVEESILVLSKIFDKPVHEVAWEQGRYSAEYALSGVYKVFVMISTPQFILRRSTKIFEKYYENAEIEVEETSDQSAILHIKKLKGSSEILEHRIAGWIQRGLEKTGGKSIDIKITKSLAKGDPLTEFKVYWK